MPTAMATMLKGGANSFQPASAVSSDRAFGVERISRDSASSLSPVTRQSRNPRLTHMLLLLLVAGPLVAGAATSFRNDVVPVLSKAGCSLGTCHGNKYGKGGFKLSLRSQDPELDWLALTRDAAARRVNPLAPDASLMLLKPTAQVPHE